MDTAKLQAAIRQKENEIREKGSNPQRQAELKKMKDLKAKLEGPANSDAGGAMISMRQVAKHNTADDCWVVLHGRAWDLTKFARVHPGGVKLITDNAGKDATALFEPIHPSDIMERMLKPDVMMGKVDPATITDDDIAKPEQPKEDPPATAEQSRGDGQSAVWVKPPLSAMLNSFDFESVASRVMTKEGWAYYSSGGDDEITLRENHAAFQRVWLRPRVMVNVKDIDMRSEILGFPTSFPLYITATALGKLADPQGEKAIVRAAAAGGVPYMMPTLSSCSLDEMVQASEEGQILFSQLYVNAERDRTKAYLDRLHASNCKALFITVDAPQLGRREKDMRNKFAQKGSDVQKDEDSKGKVNRNQGVTRAISQFIDPSLNWKSLQWFKDNTHMPILLKGVQCGEDAVLAYQHGLAGIVVSNHGGRQLDTARSALEILPEVMSALHEAAGGRLDPKKFAVFLDGGVRRGSDIFKAIALGATAVGIGRPTLYSLASFGEEGVVRLLDLLKEESEMVMRLMGTPSIADISPKHCITRNLSDHGSGPTDFLSHQTYQPLTAAAKSLFVSRDTQEGVMEGIDFGQLFFGACVAIMLHTFWKALYGSERKLRVDSGGKMQRKAMYLPKGPSFTRWLYEMELKKKLFPHLQEGHTGTQGTGATLRFFKEFGQIFSVSLGGRPLLFVSDEETARYLLSSPATKYHKAPDSSGVMVRLVGDSVLLVEGDEWKKQRRIIRPAFQHSFISELGWIMGAKTMEMIEAFGKEDVVYIDAQNEMTKLTFNIIGKTAFGYDFEDPIYSKEFTHILEEMSRPLRRFLWFYDYLPLPSNWKLRKSFRRLEHLVGMIIRDRASSLAGSKWEKTWSDNYKNVLDLNPNARVDLPQTQNPKAKEKYLVDMLIRNKSLSDKQLKDNIMTFLLAGHETSANALSFALYLLASHPEKQRRAQEEVDLFLKEGLPDPDNLQRFIYVRMVIKESLRLFPPAPMVGRVAQQNDEWPNGIVIPKNAMVLISVHALHRSPELWKDPDSFIPERFEGDVPKAYAPFSEGRRTCIGDHFTMTEMTTVIVLLLKHFTLVWEENTPFGVEQLATLRPKFPTPIKLLRR